MSEQSRWSASPGRPLFGAALALYAIVLCALSGRLSLWVDEILQAGATRDDTWGGMLRWVSVNPGGVPLGYVTQRVTFGVLGWSTFAARFPSIGFSILCCAGVALLGRELGLKAARGVLLLFLFMVLPLQFRYAWEARPYSEALFWSIAATDIFLFLVRRPGYRLAAAYAAIAAAGLYTQPFSFFVAVAHIAWAAREADRRVFKLTLAGAATALTAFLPWFLFARSPWHESIVANHFVFRWNGAFSVVFKEMAGGYALSALLVLGIGFSFAAGSQLPARSRALVLTILAATVGGGLCADAAFGYFLAARQFIFALPAVAVLAADGFWSLFESRRVVGGAAILSALTVALALDAGPFRGPREDWAQATAAIEKKAQSGACVLTIPAGWSHLYEFFDSRLRTQKCGTESSNPPKVILVTTPYTVQSLQTEYEQRLQKSGFSLRGAAEWAGGSRIETFEKAGLR
jgi:hypothetical protein